MQYAIVTLLLASLCLADEPQDRTFAQWDKNGDGRLVRGELPPFAQRNFDRVDTDKDGFISRDEHRAFLNRPRPSTRPASDKIKLKQNLSYAANDNPRQAIDLYLPKKRTVGGKLPLIAWIHGGAWRAGSRRAGLNRVRRFVESGKYVGASIGYRLTGEAIWPAQIHDCKAAIRWLKANADRYGYDADRICVYGSSAGGHLVAMLGTTGNVKELEGSLGNHPDQSSSVAGVIDLFGPTNFLTMNDFPSRIDHDASDSPESILVGKPIQTAPERCANASPIHWASRDDAPILIMHGTADKLVAFDQSVQLHRTLTTLNVPVWLVPVQDGGHGFGGTQVDGRIDAFLQKIILGRSNTKIDETAVRSEQ